LENALRHPWLRARKITAHNIQFTLRRSSGLAYEKLQSSLRSFVVFFSGTFLQLLECFAFLYRNCKNVVNFSRYAQSSFEIC
jgi:hypothetical protein